jgi:O-antigen ligase
VYIQLSLFVVIVLRVITGLHRVGLTRTQIVVLSILGVTVCATLVGQVFGVSGLNLGRIPESTRFLVIALACVLELNSARRAQQALVVVMATAAVVSLFSIVNLFVTLPFAFTGQVRSLGPLSLGIPRSLGIWMSFGSFGVLAMIGGSYAAMSVFRPQVLHGSDSRYARVFSAVSLSLILLGVVVGQSRSTLLATLLVGVWALVVATIHPDDRIRSRLPAIPGSLLMIGAAGVSINAVGLVTSFIGTNVASVTGRLEQYRIALDLLAQSPVFGWGWGYFPTVFDASYTVHNLWLQIGVSLGVPILLLWIYLFGLVGVSLLRQAVNGIPWARPYGLIGTAMLIGSSVELALYPGFMPVAATLIGIVIGIQALGTTDPVSRR